MASTEAQAIVILVCAVLSAFLLRFDGTNRSKGWGRVKKWLHLS